MWNEQLPGEMRARLRSALPEKAFIRRDRGEALFISNAPAFEPGPISIPGFHLEIQGGLLRILPDESWIVRIEDHQPQPPSHLCATLLRFRGQEADRANLLLFARGIKLLDAGCGASMEEISAYDRDIRQRAALALRGGCGGGALYASALLNAKIHSLI